MLVDMKVCLQHPQIYRSQPAAIAFSFEPKYIVFLTVSDVCYIFAETLKIALKVYK